MKKVAVVLSGCGVYDGSEIHEAVLTLLALDKAGAQAICTAPDIYQQEVVNHLTGQPVPGERRQVLVESARIARGKIVPLSQLRPEQIDAAILPGGMGAAKNLSDFATKGAQCQVLPELAAFLTQVHRLGKPIGLVCIAPVLAARLFGSENVELTIGTSQQLAATLEEMGARHLSCPVTDCIVDRKRKIVSTPAYMLAKRINEVEQGITKLVHAVLELA